jgi:cellulose synthase/poly-beta-1,6-N-acetylglucosamine synthase-like glycosyltransferase
MLEHILSTLMYPFLFLSMFFQVLLLVSFFENRKKIDEEEFDHMLTYFPTVTVAVPCWNEERTLAGTLDSLLELDYPKDRLSIVVVDDGSSDGTLAIAQEYESRHPGLVKAVHKANGGKHTAVNLALEGSTSDLFGCLDADSFVAPHTLKTIVSYFERNPKIMAVTPCIHIRHPRTFIQRMQAIEYLMGVFVRKAFGSLDAIQVTPGPFSIFKREVFGVIGNYHKAHNTEDFEITLRMHKAHFKIANSHKALVYTIGPATARGFFYQRLRWARGFLENSLDYRELFFKKEYGNFGMFTLPMAFMFVFYGLYAAVFTIYSATKSIGQMLSRWATVGIHFHVPQFDPFYINTNIMSFVVMIMFTIFLLVLYISNTLTDDRQQFYRNFPFFFFLYPLFVPVFLGRAVFDTFFKQKNVWVLQDTKK